MRKISVIFVLTLIFNLIGCDNKNPIQLEISTLTDIDGNIYDTVKIGDQWWMAENLKVKKYRNGDHILNLSNASLWESNIIGAYCSYGNFASTEGTYGLLYNWYAVADNRNIAPEGWHVPTDEDWKKLETYLGLEIDEINGLNWRGDREGGKLKKEGTNYWIDPNKSANNETGFTALPGGQVFYTFDKIRYYGYFWTSSENNDRFAWNRSLGYLYSSIHREATFKNKGLSVRLVKD